MITMTQIEMDFGDYESPWLDATIRDRIAFQRSRMAYEAWIRRHPNEWQAILAQRRINVRILFTQDMINRKRLAYAKRHGTTMIHVDYFGTR
jgi:hypothetical protein